MLACCFSCCHHCSRSDHSVRTRRSLDVCLSLHWLFFFFQAEDGIRDIGVTGVQTCALPISSIPELTRSGLHRCFARHGISRLPKAGDDGAGKRRFKAYPLGYFHLDIAEVRTEQGKLHLFVAVDRTSKFAFAQLHEKATRRAAANFLHALVEAVPYRVHTALTDNGVQFTDTLPADEDPEAEAAIDAIWAARGEARLCRAHAFEHARDKHGVEHRQTKPYHPWRNGEGSEGRRV